MYKFGTIPNLSIRSDDNSATGGGRQAALPGQIDTGGSWRIREIIIQGIYLDDFPLFRTEDH